MKIGELFFEIGAKTGKFQADLKSAQVDTLAFGAGVVGAGYALEKMFTSSARTGTMLYNLSQQSGIAANKLDQLSIAANMTNAAVSTDEAAQSFARLNQVLLSVQRGGANPFQSSAWLVATGYQGINVAGKSTLEVAEDLRQIIGKLRPDMAAAALSASGIFKPEMVDFFSLSKDKFNTLGEATALSNENVGNLKNADAAIEGISNSLKRIKDNAMGGLAPMLETVADSMKSGGKPDFSTGQKTGFSADRQENINQVEDEYLAEKGVGGIAVDALVRGFSEMGSAANVSLTRLFASKATSDKVTDAWLSSHGYETMGGGSSQPAAPSTGSKAEQLAALEKKYGLQAGLLSAVEKQESGGNTNAVSPKGAKGAFQFMDATAKQYGVDVNDWSSSAEGAAHMFSDLAKKYGGDTNKMLAAYNWGQGNVDKYGLENAPKETKDYVKNISPNITLNNNFNITGSNASAISDAVLDKQQQSLKQAQASIMVNY